MRTRARLHRVRSGMLLILAAALILAAGCGGGGSGVVSARSAEATFARAHLRLDWHWRPTRKNATDVAPQTGPIAWILPRSFRSALRGIAAWQSNTTFVQRALFVFDSSSAASRFGIYAKTHVQAWTSVQSKYNTVIVARNLVYLGENDSAARHVMTKLRG